MAFDLQPTLTGELVQLRPLRLDDCDAVFAAARDARIWEQHPEPTRYTRPVFQKYFDGAMASGGGFAVLDRATGAVIGCTRYYGFAPGPPSEIEIGYTFLQRAYWGGQYNGEMKRLMLTHALAALDCVVFRAGENNFRSCHALEKIGAKRVGYFELPAGDGSRNVRFEIHRGDYHPQA